MDSLAQTQKALVGWVNLLGLNQEHIMTTVNDIIQCQQDQEETMTQFVGHTQMHLRVMTLRDIVSDALDQLSAQDQQVILA